jgi:hypothetical protein
MDLRPLLLVPVLALALSACSSAQDAVDAAQSGTKKVKDCAGLAQDVFGIGLNNTPTPAEAKKLKETLDKRVDNINDADVRAAATSLRDRLADLTTALQKTDQAQIQASFNAARTAAQDAAKACNLPAGSFIK